MWFWKRGLIDLNKNCLSESVDCLKSEARSSNGTLKQEHVSKWDKLHNIPVYV